MTVLVGVRCEDAVIIGSDSAVSTVVGNSYTVEHPARKISIIDDQIIVAGTGSLGLGQRFVGVVSDLWENRHFVSKAPVEIARIISHEALKNFTSTNAPLSYGALVTFPNKQKAELCEFEYPSLQPELKKDDSWYVSMGSGQLVADTLLGVARKTFWRRGPPSREDGIFAAIWVLNLTIEICPSPVSPPIQMAILESRAGKRIARYLSGDEISQHESQVSPLMEYFGAYKDNLEKAEVSAPDTPSPDKSND